MVSIKNILNKILVYIKNGWIKIDINALEGEDKELTNILNNFGWLNTVVDSNKLLVKKIFIKSITKSYEERGWHIIEYPDGYCQCEFTHNPGPVTIGISRGNGWYSSNTYTLNFPIIFTSAPSVSAAANISTEAYIVLPQMCSLTSSSIVVRFVASASIPQNSNYQMSVKVSGYKSS